MTKNRTRLNPTDRSDAFISAVLELAKEKSFSTITRDEVGARVGCAPALLHYYFKTLDDLKNQAMKRAIDYRDLAVIAQGLAMRHEVALTINKTLRLKVTQYLNKG